MTTFTDLDIEAAELAFALWSAEDAPDLDSAALLALDIIDTLGDYAAEWDLDAGLMEMPEGDVLDTNGMRA